MSAKNPVNTYTSTCCKAPAVKDACERDEKDRVANTFSQNPLGTWHCNACKKKCKVTHRRNTEVAA
jgi:hypothetical protein